MSKTAQDRREIFKEFEPTFMGRADGPRTPLHVEFAGNDCFVPAEALDIKTYRRNLARFNAVGSRTVKTGKVTHQPVIDIDGGAELQIQKSSTKLVSRTKVILGASYAGTYEPKSQLRDLLGDYNIDAEVFSFPKLHTGSMSRESYLERMQTKALVLRSDDPSIFEVVDSTSSGHNHLYIQQEFSATDHITLIQELGALGVVSPAWQKMVEQEQMSIVRTPWTVKARLHYSS